MSILGQESPITGGSTERSAAGLPFVAAIDGTDTPFDVVDTLALVAFTNGDQPWARCARIDRLKPGASLLPEGARVIRTVSEEARDARLATGEGWTVRSVRWRGGGAEVLVTAVSEELARTVLDSVVRRAAVESAGEGAVNMGFWYMSHRGPTRITRRTVTPSWSAIRANYASGAKGELDRLMAMQPENILGRLILLHGPAGTGKTTVLRALAHEWRRWCQVDCVLDPETLFNEPGYLMEVAIGFDESDDETPADEGSPGILADSQDGTEARRRWRLLVIEDCDDLIRDEGRGSTGKALSRLLNLTDGLLGQGRDVLVALTTNEDLAQLHPAVVRPGRCLARIEVGPLPFQEAVTWLGTSEGIRASMTLAELFALRDGRLPTQAAGRDEYAGLYL